MASRASNTGINCDNAFELSEWWKSVIGYSEVPSDPNEEGDEECMIVDLDQGRRLLLNELQDPRVESILIWHPSIRAPTRQSSEFSEWVPHKWPTAATPTGPAGWSWPTQPATSSTSFAATRNVAWWRRSTAELWLFVPNMGSHIFNMGSTSRCGVAVAER
jgi:hypothetical protein